MSEMVGGSVNRCCCLKTQQSYHTSEVVGRAWACTRKRGVVWPSALRPPSAGVMVVPDGATPPKLRPGLPNDCMREFVCRETGGSDAVGCCLDAGDWPPDENIG